MKKVTKTQPKKPSRKPSEGLGVRMQRAFQFIRRDLWDVELTSLSMIKRQVVKMLRICHLTLRGFREDELPLRASGLTFVTLFALAPLLAFMFTVFRGMGRGQEMIVKLKDYLAEMPEQIESFMLNILNYIESSSTVGLGGFAVAILIFSVIKAMTNMEKAFNKVWGISNHRPVMRRITDYVSTLVLVPMLIIVAGALSGFRATEFWLSQPAWVQETYGRTLALAPVFSAWIAFGFMYLFLPNTKVRFGPVAISGLAAALVWLAWQKFYIASQSILFAGESKDKVFGAFAAVPIFMFWIYVCWVIVLFGAELAFAIQNSSTYALEQKSAKASDETRLLLALNVVLDMSHVMVGDRPTFNVNAYAREHGVPIRLLHDVIHSLSRAGLVGALSEKTGEYALLRSPEQIQAKEIFDLLIRDGAPPRAMGVQHLSQRIATLWRDADRGLTDALDGATFRDLADAPASEPADVTNPAAESGTETATHS